MGETTATPRPDRRRPLRRLAWEERDDGGVDVLRPKFGTGRLGRWISSRLSRPHLRIRLDATGGFVWRRCDGNHTVDDIVQALRQDGDDGSGDAAERLRLFLDRMAARGLIGFGGPEASGSRGEVGPRDLSRARRPSPRR